MKPVFLSVVLLALSHAALAQDGYFGAGFGQARVDIEEENIPGVAEDIDDESTTFKLFGGFFMGKNADLEIAYIDFGEFSKTLDDGVDRLKLKVDGSAFALSLVGRVPFSEQDSLFIRGGLYRWDLDMSARIEGATFGTQSESDSDDGVDLLLGLGFEHDFGGWGLRAEWERYTDLGSDTTGGTTDLDFLNLAVLARF